MQFHYKQLSNGLEVVFEGNEDAHSVSAGFFVKTGSRDESPDEAGLSHFLEHMVFKGTARRDALAVNRDFDRVGAKHNAQTSEEDTIYHVTSLPEYLPNAFDVLADIMRPRLDEADFVTEKQVILEEIHMYNDNPMMVAYEAAKEEHFGVHPLGRSVLGTVGSISAMELERMRDYFRRRYSPKNIVLAVAGRARWEQVIELAESQCGEWEGGEASRTLDMAAGGRGSRSIQRKDDQQMTIIGVADAPPLESKDRYAASLLTAILGDHTGSRLYWELIDPGFADGVDLSYQEFNNAGAYFTFLSCDPEVAQANLDRLRTVFQMIERSGPSISELDQARNKVLSRLVLRGERPMGRLMTLGYHWLYRHRHVTVESELAEFSAVTNEQIVDVLKRYPLLPMTIVTARPRTDLQIQN
jgi:predicted Zn-dependent peptidase